MRLSDIDINNIDFQVYKDGDFNLCGFLHQKKKNMLSFISSKKYISMIKNPNISSIICTEDILEDVMKMNNTIGIILYNNPRELIFRISDILSPKKFESRISDTSEISKNAIISNYNVIIGDNCIIEDHVIIKENVVIGNNVRIGSGTILGGEALMLYDSINGKNIAKHNGFLYIDSGVKMLYNNVIEKAIFKGDVTYIGKNVVFDSLNAIGHGCRISSDIVITVSSKICGYTEIGSGSYIGPGATISNNLKIGSNCNIRIGSIVINNLEDNSDVSSSFAINHNINLINGFRIVKQYSNIKKNR